MRRKISLLSVVLFLIFQLSEAHPRMYVKVMKPAPVTIPHHIKTIAIIDRTTPSDQRKNIIEGVLTGEGIGQDARGAEIAIDGVISLLNNSARFEVVKRTNLKYQGNSLRPNFSEPLNWSTISKICNDFQVDAVLSLEYFDSDFIITDGKKEVVKKDQNGREIKTMEYYAQGIASVKSGFRLYDPVNKVITDEKMFDQTGTYSASGSNVKDALAHLINRNEAIKNVSYDMGRAYAERISPVWITVSRIYYKKGKRSADLAAGARKMEVNDWEGAISYLEKAMNHKHIKVKRRAAHNLAVVYEVLGDFDMARDWAQKAYSDYGNKDSKSYVYWIEQRVREEQLLREQLGE